MQRGLYQTKVSKYWSAPVQYEVLCKDEFARAVDGPPDEANHQYLQPRALQEQHLVVE